MERIARAPRRHWARIDGDRELVFVYLTDLLLGLNDGIRHHGEVSDAVLRAYLD